MKKMKGCLILSMVLGLAGILPASIIQNFGFAPDAAYMRIDTPSTVEEVNPYRAQGEDFDVTPTGFTWGGYCAPVGYNIEIDRIARGGATFEELVFKQNPTGSYAYTIFDSAGGNTPNQSVDLSGAGSNIHLKISDIWSGWFGNGDNGSGLPGVESEARATVLRAMVRDGNGDWYVSDLFCPSTLEDSSTDGTIVEYSFVLDGKSWYAVDSAVSTNLNLLAGGDEVALSYAAAAGAPDLTAVTGGGILVWSAYATANGQFAMTEIQWNNGIPEPATLLLLSAGLVIFRKR